PANSGSASAGTAGCDPGDAPARCATSSAFCLASSRVLWLPLARENLSSRARHVDVVVVAPGEFEIAARQVGLDGALRTARQHAGHAHGAGARSACQRDPGAAFPGAHRDFAWAMHLNEVNV